MTRLFSAVTVLLLLASAASAASKTVDIIVSAGKFDRVNVPVSVPLTLPADLAGGQVLLSGSGGKALPAQLTAPSLLAHPPAITGTEVARELHFVLPELKAGATAQLKASIDTNANPSKIAKIADFAWQDTPGEYDELKYKGNPVLRYVYHPLDESTPARREQTFKVFHHLFDPAGKQLVTKGPGGLYTHHRGLFYGFMNVTYGDGKKVDIWHCKEDTYQGHDKFLSQEAGDVLGRQRLLIGWHGKKKVLFAREERELTVYAVPGGLMIEFASRLTPVQGTVKVDGDPQHAGFHFRASNEVNEKSKAETIFIRPDGPGKPGETRNWDPKTKKGPVDLPWNAMSFVVGGQRYTATYLDKPTNPKEARFSERDYGRFGSYFVAEATEKKPLEVNYRIWLQEGQMTVDQVAALSHGFVDPVQVSLK